MALRGGWTTALLLYLGLHWTPMAWDHLIRLQTGAAGLVRTEGRVERTRAQMPPCDNGRCSYGIDYSFGGGKYRGQESPDLRDWVWLHPGVAVTVWYDTHDPNQNTLAPPSRFLQVLPLFLTLIVTIFAGLALSRQMRDRLRAAVLRAQGRRATATVTHVLTGNRPNPVFEGRTVYWKDAEGHPGKSFHRLVWFQMGHCPNPGDRVSILTDPSGQLPAVWVDDVEGL